MKELTALIGWIRRHQRDEGLSFRKMILFAYTIFAGIAIFVFWYLFLFSNRHPQYIVKKSHPDIAIAEKIRGLKTTFDMVILDLGGFQVFYNANYVPGYPQIFPIAEYYAGSKPILCFDSSSLLVKDLVYLVRHSPFRFSPVVVSKDSEHLQEIISLLRQEEILIQTPKGEFQFLGKYILDLTDYLKWKESSRGG